MMKLQLSPVKSVLVAKPKPIEPKIAFRDLAELCKYDVIADLAKIGIKVDLVAFVGSSYINQTLTNDLDILVYLQSENMVKISQNAQGALDNWCEGGSFDNEDLSDDVPSFRSYRIDWHMDGISVDINVIAVNNKDEFRRFVQAADVCRLLQYCNKDIPKDLRIDIHNMIRNNVSFDQLLEEKGLT